MISVRTIIFPSDAPRGVKEQAKAEITDVKTTKNSIKYTVTTKTQDQPYYHMVLSEAFMSFFLMQYQGKDLSTMTDAELNAAFVTLMSAGYGEGAIGTKTYNVQDGVKNASGETRVRRWRTRLLSRYVRPRRERWQVQSRYTDEVSENHYTRTGREGSATLDVEYKGLDADGHALFSVIPGKQIKTLHMVIGTSRSIDEFISLFGYEWLMFTQGSDFTADQWNELTDEDKGWNIESEDDYSFYVLPEWTPTATG